MGTSFSKMVNDIPLVIDYKMTIDMGTNSSVKACADSSGYFVSMPARMVEDSSLQSILVRIFSVLCVNWQ